MIYAQFYTSYIDHGITKYDEGMGSDSVCYFDGRLGMASRHLEAIKHAYNVRKHKQYTHYRIMSGTSHLNAQPIVKTYFPCVQAWALAD